VRALVKTARGDGHIELRDVAEPVAKPGWVVLQVTGAGICGTDIHILHDRHPYWPPVTLGHEFTGRVAEVGPEVQGWNVGDRVVCEPHVHACGVCSLCRRGKAHLCASKRSPGWGIDGALADFVAVPAHLLHRVPGEVSDRAAAVCEPTAIALTALGCVGVGPGETVLVLGPGPIGLLAAMAAEARGAARVVGVGRTSSRQRLRLAANLGLEAWNSDDGDVAERAKDATGGVGADAVIDTSGAAAAIASGVAALRRAGRFCAVGVNGQPSIAFPWDQALFAALELRFSFSSAHDTWDAALAMMRSGAVRPEPLVTVFALHHWQEAFRRVEAREVTKAQLVP
jgi:L-iditol 2-dehydrogenase